MPIFLSLFSLRLCLVIFWFVVVTLSFICLGFEAGVCACSFVDRVLFLFSISRFGISLFCLFLLLLLFFFIAFGCFCCCCMHFFGVFGGLVGLFFLMALPFLLFVISLVFLFAFFLFAGVFVACHGYSLFLVGGCGVSVLLIRSFIFFIAVLSFVSCVGFSFLSFLGLSVVFGSLFCLLVFGLFFFMFVLLNGFLVLLGVLLLVGVVVVICLFVFSILLFGLHVRLRLVFFVCSISGSLRFFGLCFWLSFFLLFFFLYFCLFFVFFCLFCLEFFALLIPSLYW
ncbi:ABC-type dipeptide/oligopeptide/nickel transport system, permease component [Lysinibacillus fusiformis]|nr:ABC-type dipeptide/oligopeptide/nickel transport system, permease component [Lysinibacillus fusiformis]